MIRGMRSVVAVVKVGRVSVVASLSGGVFGESLLALCVDTPACDGIRGYEKESVRKGCRDRFEKPCDGDFEISCLRWEAGILSSLL